MNFKQQQDTYDLTHSRNRAQKIAEEISSYFPSGPIHVLEYGCKSGEVANFLAKRPSSLTLIDECDDMIAHVEALRTQQAHDHISTATVDSLDDDANQTYDVIYASLALHQKSEALAVLTKLGTLLSPKGQLVIVELLPTSQPFYECETGREHDAYTIDELSQLLLQANLTPSIGRKFFSGYKPLTSEDKQPYSLFSISATK